MMTKSGILGVTVLFLPVIELVALLAVGNRLGVLNTLVLFVGLSATGAWLLRIRLAGAATALTAIEPGADVPRSVASSVLAVVGAALLLLPGFVTAVVGVVLQVGPVRRLVAHRVTSRFTTAVTSVGGRFIHTDVIDVDLVDSRPGPPDRRPHSPPPGELERSN
jgi:UPF0716 protein FxsA